MQKIVAVYLAACSFTLSSAQSLKETAQHTNEFAFHLFSQVSQPGENTFISPFSISSAVAMAYAGADNETAIEIARVMRFGREPEFHRAYSTLLNEITSRNNADIHLNVANRLFGDRQFKFNPPYLDILAQNYRAPLETLDFSSAPEQSRLYINSWVESNTKNKIQELLKKGMVHNQTKLVLVNAIYFYADWDLQFDSARTHTRDFYIKGNEKKPVKTMFLESGFEYMENDELKAIRIPYRHRQLSMEIYLPKQLNGLAQLEKKLTYGYYTSCINQMHSERVMVWLPAFKLTGEYSLAEPLKKMGMPLAFSDAADFSKITGKKELKIDAIVHKAFIEVNEKGTEAAAATAITMVPTSSAMNIHETTPKQFCADHPFLFILRDNATGVVLFMGKVNSL